MARRPYTQTCNSRSRGCDSRRYEKEKFIEKTLGLGNKPNKRLEKEYGRKKKKQRKKEHKRRVVSNQRSKQHEQTTQVEDNVNANEQTKRACDKRKRVCGNHHPPDHKKA
jgi:hypothetical protein